MSTSTRRRRKPRERDAHAFLGMVRRMLLAGARRVANEGDEPELLELLQLQHALDEAFQVAVDGWRARGISWATIGAAAGVSKQAAQARWGRS